MRTAIGYVRVSTTDQADEGVSLETQEHKIRCYCELHGLELIDIVEDAGLSAKSITGRPGFRSVLDRLTRGEADGFVVTKLDRAFRSTRDAIDTAEKLSKAGKHLHSISEKIDTTSAIGEFFFTLIAALAQLERKQLAERVVVAMDTKRRKGELIGSVPFGFDLDSDGVHLVPVAEEQKIIERIASLQAQGYSFREIARKLNQDGITTKNGKCWTHRQVARIARAA